MAEFLQELRVMTRSILERLTTLLSETPTSTLQLTGVLGLAALLFGLYHYRSSGTRKPRPGELDSSATGTSPSAAAGTKPATPAAPAATPATGLRETVRSQLSGVRAVTLSVPGVLLQEWTPQELQEAATLKPEAGAVLREVARFAEVYLLAHVEDDVGEATVRGALEAGGLLGFGPGLVKPHRLLFCSTLEGKVSIVRQIEPELHVDGHPATITALQRFMPQLLHITGASQPKLPVMGNVGSAPSLAAVFGGAR